VPPLKTPDDLVRDTVRRWNDAHARRDAQGLDSVYAESVSHYGKTMKKADVIKAKAAAFAAAPDFTQSIGEVALEPGLNRDQTVARFTKTVTQKGKTNAYPAMLELRDDKIEEENDDVDWCRAGDGSGINDLVVPPFEMSASEAVRRAYETKHFKEGAKKYPGLVIDTQKGFGCAKACAKPSFECGFHMRTSDSRSTAPSNLVEWMYVDPIGQKIWFYDHEAMAKDPDAGEIWKSEPLPRLPPAN
jgi:hypothetical protein